MRSIKDAAIALDRACKAAKVQYALIKGFAVMAWGQPRMTMSVDALVVFERTRLKPFRDACRTENLEVSLDDLDAALRAGGHATIFDSESSYHVDAKLALSPDEIAEVGRAGAVEFPEGTLTIARPEDTVAFKLLFGAPHDMADARSILVRQGASIDSVLLKTLCKRLGIVKELDRVLKEIQSESIRPS